MDAYPLESLDGGELLVDYFLLKRYKAGSRLPIITADNVEELSPPIIFDIIAIRIAVITVIIIIGRYFFIFNLQSL